MFWFVLTLVGYGVACGFIGMAIGHSRAYGEIADAIKAAKARSEASRNE
jgi:hypothetical protein